MAAKARAENDALDGPHRGAGSQAWRRLVPEYLIFSVFFAGSRDAARHAHRIDSFD